MPHYPPALNIANNHINKIMNTLDSSMQRQRGFGAKWEQLILTTYNPNWTRLGVAIKRQYKKED
jgi:hypothetical protein